MQPVKENHNHRPCRWFSLDNKNKAISDYSDMALLAPRRQTAAIKFWFCRFMRGCLRTPFLWWERMDLNHRSVAQQIYSLPPLATRELSHIQFNWWSRWTDSNPRPADYKSAALPTELHRHWVHSQRCYITTSPSKCQAVF